MEPNKKVLCRYFPECRRDGCAWGHGELMTVWKTRMCIPFSRGETCPFAVCGFAHGRSELRKNSHDQFGNIYWCEMDHRWKRRRVGPPLTTKRLAENSRLTVFVDNREHNEVGKKFVADQLNTINQLRKRKRELKEELLREKRKRTRHEKVFVSSTSGSLPLPPLPLPEPKVVTKVVTIDPMVHIRRIQLLNALKKSFRLKKKLN